MNLNFIPWKTIATLIFSVVLLYFALLHLVPVKWLTGGLTDSFPSHIELKSLGGTLHEGSATVAINQLSQPINISWHDSMPHLNPFGWQAKIVFGPEIIHKDLELKGNVTTHIRLSANQLLINAPNNEFFLEVTPLPELLPGIKVAANVSALNFSTKINFNQEPGPAVPLSLKTHFHLTNLDLSGGILDIFDDFDRLKGTINLKSNTSGEIDDFYSAVDSLTLGINYIEILGKEKGKFQLKLWDSLLSQKKKQEILWQTELVLGKNNYNTN